MRLACLLFGALAAPAFADTGVWLIGGGNTLDNSQEQIETNVRWLETLLLADGVDVRTYFALGEHPGMDVAFLAPAETQRGVAAPWSQIFDTSATPGVRYRRHELQALRGSTYKKELIANLSNDFAQLSGDDELLIVYNGHGGRKADTRDNYLKLWGDETLSVSELGALLDVAPRDTTTRFVMTQCYSGAFHALIYDDPRAAKGFRGNRCGFMAESDTRLAEGCELDLNQGDLRDYTTYFFAALSGTSRRGEPLARAAVDRDENGVVSYREAHFHALVAAHSADLSRSTSEQFLEEWSPWHLRWDSLADNPDSIYWRLASEVAARNGWNPTSEELHRVIRRSSSALADVGRQRIDAKQRLGEQRARLHADVIARWPAAANAQSSSALGEDLPVVLAELENDPRYRDLQRQERSLSHSGGELLELTRTFTQAEKVYRLRHLARLERALQTYGDSETKERYSQLLECEAGSL